jgi:hypothetical protein
MSIRRNIRMYMKPWQFMAIGLYLLIIGYYLGVVAACFCGSLIYMVKLEKEKQDYRIEAGQMRLWLQSSFTKLKALRNRHWSNYSTRSALFAND